ncbi:MAG: recombinase family protein [Bacteroides cellulosilyticus]|nr:recombinase family protein [Bacteroides cellulosilyticus]
MASYLYLRVSTNAQAFAQQMQDIKAYGIDPDKVDGIVEEHESGGKSYADRKLQQLLNKCKAGDTIFAASTDRLGRSFVDMVRLMEDAKRRGVIIVACKQNLSLADDNMMGQMALTVNTIIDEDERKRIRHRVKNGVSVALEEIKRNGFRMTKHGTKQTHWGNEKGCDMSAANEASCLAKQEAVITWRENSTAYKWAMTKIAENWPRKVIIEEFNKLHELQPTVFCTREGKPLSKGVLSKWAREANPIALVG